VTAAEKNKQSELPRELVSLQKQYDAAVSRTMRPLNRNYKKALKNLQRKLARQNRLEDAMAVKAALEVHAADTEGDHPVGNQPLIVGKTTDIARDAKVTAAEHYKSLPPHYVNDGDMSTEWATGKRGKMDTWLKLTWPEKRTIVEVDLHDRANSTDWMQEAELEFSDRTKINVKGIPNDGSSKLVKLKRPVKATWMKIRPTKQSPGTLHVGLREVVVRGK